MYGTDVVVTARTCVLLPVRNRIWRCYCLVFDEVWGRNLILMRYFAVQIHYNNDHNDCALSLNIWTGCYVGPEQTARTFALRLNLKVLLAFNIVWSRNVTSLCAIQTRYDGAVLIFAGWMYGTGFVLTPHEQSVRLYSCVCAWIWSCC